MEVRTINSSRNVIMNRGEIYLTRSQTVQTVTEEYTFERAQRSGSSHLTAQCWDVYFLNSENIISVFKYSLPEWNIDVFTVDYVISCVLSR